MADGYDYQSLRVGNLRTPLTITSGQTLLQDADPSLYNLIGFFEAVIRIHLGARFNQAVQAAGLPELDGYVVASTVPYDPAYYLTEAQFPFPILACYRLDSKVIERTRHYSQKISTWGFDYVLPPLSAGQAEQLLPILAAVESVLLDRIDRGFDPSYNGGEHVFIDSGLTSFRVLESSFVRLEPKALAQTNATFPELHMRLECKEQVRPIDSDFATLETITVDIDNTDGYNVFPDIVNFTLKPQLDGYQ